MKRFRIHVHVGDLGESIAFYSKLFVAGPARMESDCVKWMSGGPRVNFVTFTHGSTAGVDHLGFQVNDAIELAELEARAEAVDMALLDEGETICCYARSDKHWIANPQGIAWKHFHSLGDILVFSEDKEGEVVTESSICYVPCAPGGKPAEIVMKSGSSCYQEPLHGRQDLQCAVHLHRQFRALDPGRGSVKPPRWRPI